MNNDRVKGLTRAGFEFSLVQRSKAGFDKVFAAAGLG